MPGNRLQRILSNRRYRARMRGEDVPLLTVRWTHEDEQLLRDAYASNTAANGWLRALAASMGRNPGNLCRKAKELGLPRDPNRSHPQRRKPRQLSMLSRLGNSRSRIGLWQVSGLQHPRGMLGKKHSVESRRKMSMTRTGRRGHPHSDAARLAQSLAMVARLRERPESINMGKRGIGGRRADLGNRYFRSRYEANYARYLNWAKVHWEYETKTFWFDAIKRGTRSYTPDFWLPAEAVFHEVKGWMDPKSATKLARMKKYHPGVKVVVIGADWFQAAERQRLCSLIPGWECKHRQAAQS